MRYGHGPSGIIGSSLNKSTLAIWAFSHSTLTQIYNDMETLKEGQEDVVVTTYKEERQSRIKDDASDRAKIQERLSTCIDILDTSKHPETGLVNVYSGRIIDDPTVNVHEAVKIGTEQQKAFEGEWPASFHLKLKRRVKNIASLVKSQLKMGKDTKAIDTGFIYARVLGIIASSREPVSIEALFSHELAPLPTALFDETGDMRTTSKAVLKNKIKIVCGVRNKPSPSIVVLDGCAILWTVPWPAAPAQVSAFINAAITTILRRADNTLVLHVVFDRYFELSTKVCCRTSRQKGNSRVFTLTEDTPLPKQSLVLNMTYNKKQLIQLIVDRLCAMQPPLGTDVVITGSDPQPVHMGSGPPLHHEEADVLMACHIINEASSGHTTIKIISDDTDVLVILAHHMHKQTGGLSNHVALFMESCSSGHNVICVNDVISSHQNIMPNLLAAHALTVCDTVSSFSGIGKASVLKTLTKFSGQFKFGNLTASAEEVTESCLQFVCLLYGEESAISLNTVRANCFKRNILGKRHLAPKLSSLPPTMAPFHAHCQRANYQVALWEAAGEPTPPHLDPLNYGYEVKQSTLCPAFGLENQLPAPPSVLNLVSCSCKTGCSSAQCTYTKMSLTCTVFYKCKGSSECRNPVTVSIDPEEQD
ncbi:hypothetical protein ACOMHN_037020 [Nucella lapillus]